MSHIIGADIGGTNSRFAHFSLEGGDLDLKHKVWLPTCEAKSFADLLAMLEASKFPLPLQDADAIVIAIAAPVRSGTLCTPANIPWTIDLNNQEVRRQMPRALLVNDFVAQAYACITHAVKDAKLMLPGTAHADGAKAIIGAGTGLGKCALMPLPEGGFCAVPSEGGHSEFPFVNDAEYEFARFARKETGRTQLIGDIVVASRGLELLHKFFTGEDLEAAEVTARFPKDAASSPDRPETLRWYSRFYARSCRNYVLEVMGTGGVFISGGVAARVPDVIAAPEFSEEFRSSETHEAMLADVPVLLNHNQNSGLWGAAAIAAQRVLNWKAPS